MALKAMDVESTTPPPTIQARKEAGRQARLRTPRSSHAEWTPKPRRPDPVELLTAQDARREPDLVPIRHGRMRVSPFTFYRGSARIMASDLADTPTSGLSVQLCGDAHLSNFGVYGSPERTLVFDINDFDETLPGPWEWDVKRLAASVVIAARNNGFDARAAREAAVRTTGAYREAMQRFAGMPTLDVWYAHITGEEVAAAAARLGAKAGARAERQIGRAYTRDSLQALGKLAETVDGQTRIVNLPPLIMPGRDLRPEMHPEEMAALVRSMLAEYRTSLQPDRKHLLHQFTFVDWGRKVVGVGSVGTRCFIALLTGRDAQDPLFLQVKEAVPSVLEGCLPKSRYHNPGERVVQGQRLMQATSDIFLGWSKGIEQGRYFYWRQLHDMKGSAEPERMLPQGLAAYGALCGWTLAHGHARSGDPVAIAAYLGKSDTFDQAVATFSEKYADQNQADFDLFDEAIRAGRLEAIDDI